jgi:type IX secretion system PorP/SprF family membrane protein
MRKLLLTTALLTGILASYAQDQQYTQFYAAPLYLNPAFAGTSIQSRASMIYRNQWPALPKSFVSYNFSYDQFFSDINSGVGIIVSHDRAGTGGLTYTSVALQYAYEIKINRKYSIRPAVSFGYGSTFLDIDRLTFGDQLARGPEAGNTLDPDRIRFAQEPVGSADFGSGVLLFSDKFWFGAALHHMNEPVQSLTSRDTRLPKRMSVHSGMRIKISELGAHSKRQFIVPAIHYQAQGLFDQVDVGVYYEYDPLVLGIWYRGIPGFKANDYGPLNQDAIAILLGYEVNNYRIGYSYDLTISTLTARSAGAHEISLMIEWASRRNKKASKRRVIPCAKF